MRAPVFAVAAIASVAAQNASTSNSNGTASVTRNNPTGKLYEAKLPEKAFFAEAYPNGKNARGEIKAVAADGGVGVAFTVKIKDLPKEGGPFSYHIHVNPVPNDGDCAKTLGHLDPFNRGEAPCDPKQPKTCQVGDLSAKWGKIDEDPFKDDFTDEFASTQPGTPAFFGNRSLVIHFANKTRLTCANFVLQEEAPTTAPPKPKKTGSTSDSSGMPTTVPASSGSIAAVGAGFVLAAAFASALALLL